MRRKLLVVEVAGLGWELVERSATARAFAPFRPAAGLFPALTCSVQATLRTATPPGQHGLLGNGFFSRELGRVLFWEQAAALVAGPRIWDRLRAAGGRVGLCFWQQSLGERADVVLSPKPVHKHHGGMIQDCYSQPPELYAQLCTAVGRPFNLMHYWGPLASHRSSTWIASATIALLHAATAPDLLLTYLPHLDYDLQRHGPQSPAATGALALTLHELGRLRQAAEAAGYDWLFVGDYAIEEVTRPPVFINRALRAAGLFAVRTIRGRAYPDLFGSAAFAVADHQVAQVFVRDPADRPQVQALCERLDGVAAVLDTAGQRARGIAHARAGELVLETAPGTWFAYPWWQTRGEEPDYAGHVDIHNKPGYDPCELLWGWPPPGISRDAGRIRGTHGRSGPGTAIAWAASGPLATTTPASLLELAQALPAALQ